MTQRIPWARVLLEGVVIVGSILLAFGIDASWEERQERARIERQFEALIREFRQTQDEIRGELEGVQRAREGTADVLELFGQGGPGNDHQELSARIGRSMNAGIFTAQHPVMTMMMTSGELVEFEDQSLLSLLGQWRAEMEHLRLDSQHLERNREEVIFRRFVELGVRLELERPTASLLDITRDPGMEAAFVLREVRAVRLAASYEAALERANRIVEVLEGVSIN